MKVTNGAETETIQRLSQALCHLGQPAGGIGLAGFCRSWAKEWARKWTAGCACDRSKCKVRSFNWTAGDVIFSRRFPPPCTSTDYHASANDTSGGSVVVADRIMGLFLTFY